MKILLAGGGTAGHINPALAIAGYAKSKDKNTQVLFVGTKKGLESTLVPKSGYDIKYVEVEGLSKKLTLKNFKSLIHMLTAKSKCKKIIKEFKPDVVVGTGGYVCAPAVMAANSMGIPTVIHEQNVFPGSAIKLLSKKSSVTAISFDESRKYLTDAKSILFTGNPIRPSILSCDRTKAREALGLKDEKFIVIFGGSLGAAKINSVALDYIKDMGKAQGKKILFATGERNFDEINNKIKELGLNLVDNINVVSYIHNMDEVMNAADLVICRSGAITVSELSALGKPAILVPSPNVTNNHQEYNARALSDSGAAITILEKDFNAKSLKSSVDKILDDEDAYKVMSTKSIELSSTNALEIIHNKMEELIK
ncbi:MAG: undecaprenyldiphospho-muramoylpentapeptide beta-N-acetylglucosaminyltransferase [Clostridia bacterium]|nr:undecaprenyldiphospho-muramoylpentapeptide beta-N-acetylglucosaminyltransferase [Clostridia bacterium]